MARDLITLNSHINQHKQITKKCGKYGLHQMQNGINL